MAHRSPSSSPEQPIDGPVASQQAVANGGCWPTPLEEKILFATFAPIQQARRELDFLPLSLNGHLAPTTTSLLPLLYSRWHGDATVDLERSAPLLERGREVYLTTWAASKGWRPHLLQLLEAFRQAGIEAMLLKGAAMIAGYYQDAALRPMADFDVLVHDRDLEPAIALLSRLKWRAEGDRPVCEILRQRRIGHAWQFSLPDDQSCDLHWRPVLRCYSPAVSAFFWDTAEAVSLCSQPVRIPSSTALLFHVCVHGLQWSWTGHTRWVADALTLLNSNRPVDWSALIRLSRNASMTVRLHTALAYLFARFTPHIPPSVLDELRGIAAPRWERRESVILLKECPLGFRDSLTWHISHFRRIRPFDEQWRQAPFWLAFVSYLRAFLDAGDWRTFAGKSWLQFRERSALRSR
jgi:Uncharacterised nucleotidyltransferase